MISNIRLARASVIKIVPIASEGHPEKDWSMNTSALDFIETIGRICHNSHHRKGPDTAAPFVKKLINKGHTSVLEHYWFVFTIHPSFLEEFCGDEEMSKGNILDRMFQSQCSYFEFNPPETSFSGEFEIHTNLRAIRGFVMSLLTDGDDMVVTFGQHLMRKLWCTFPDFVEDIIGEPWKEESAYDEFFTVFPSRSVMTVHIVTDRAVSHELVRHRTLSFTQQSQRYVDMLPENEEEDLKPLPVIPPEDYFDWSPTQQSIWEDAMDTAGQAYLDLRNEGCPPQEARVVLPNSVKTEIVVTGTENLWAHFLDLRTHDKVYPPMKSVADKIKELFTEKCE